MDVTKTPVYEIEAFSEVFSSFIYLMTETYNINHKYTIKTYYKHSLAHTVK